MSSCRCLTFFLFELLDVEESHLPVGIFVGGGDEEFVFAESALFSSAAMNVFHGFQSFEVEAGLGFGPLSVFAELATGEETEILFELGFFHAFAHEGLNVF